MNADDFANRLETLAPSLSDFMRLGLGVAEAERFRASYCCRRISQTAETDPLMDLCSNFDVTKLEIGMVTFARPSKFEDGFWRVGSDEDDPIVYSIAERTISLRDHAKPSYQICQCARTSDGFLSALLLVVEHNNRYLLEPELRDDSKVATECLERCLLFAGEETRPFYAVLLGTE